MDTIFIGKLLHNLLQLLQMLFIGHKEFALTEFDSKFCFRWKCWLLFVLLSDCPRLKSIGTALSWSTGTRPSWRTGTGRRLPRWTLPAKDSCAIRGRRWTRDACPRSTEMTGDYPLFVMCYVAKSGLGLDPQHYSLRFRIWWLVLNSL